MKKLLLVFVAAIATFALASCEAVDYVNPEVLEVQLIPSRDSAVLDAQRAPLEALLEAELDMEVNVTVATDYNGLIEAMASNQVHVGLLAPASYVLAADEGAAEVILKALRYDVADDGSPLTTLVDGYKSQLVVAADSGITGVQDLVGKKIAISSFTSTSGFVWPANLLADNNIDPQTDVTWVNAGGHDNAILAVINGDADAAFTFKDARTLVVGDYPNVNQQVVFLQDTENIPNDTISVIPTLDPDLKEKIQDAFLAIAQDPAKIAIMDAIYSHKGYAVAVDSEYDIVRTYLERQKDWDFS